MMGPGQGARARRGFLAARLRALPGAQQTAVQLPPEASQGAPPPPVAAAAVSADAGAPPASPPPSQQQQQQQEAQAQQPPAAAKPKRRQRGSAADGAQAPTQPPAKRRRRGAAAAPADPPTGAAAEGAADCGAPPAAAAPASRGGGGFPVPAALRAAAEELRAALEGGEDGAFGSPPPESAVRAVLSHYYGFGALRPGQKEVVVRVAQGQSTVAVLPTGLGKSLCYQLPMLLALLARPDRPRFCLVVTPLLSLLRDQLRQLPSGLRGASLSSTLGADGMRAEELKVRRGNVHVLYVTPERAADSANFHCFLEEVREMLAFVCVDEAHCISEWSHNFRPSYLRLRRSLLMRHSLQRVLCLTATAPRHTADDIVRVLRLPLPRQQQQQQQDPGSASAVSDQVSVHGCVVRYDAPRRNLRLSCEVLPEVGDAKDQERAWLDAAARVIGNPPFSQGPVVCYVQTQLEAEVIADYLLTRGIDAVGYSADSAGRFKRQDDFVLGQEREPLWSRQGTGRAPRVVVATIAFGMGIDKSDVRGIVHMMLPGTVEAYMQQIGRAGRDGQVAYCHAVLRSKFVHQACSRAFETLPTDSAVRQLVETALDVKATAAGAQGVLAQGIPHSLKVQPLSTEMDVRPEVTETMLTILCNYQPQFIKPAGTVHGTATFGFPSAGKGKGKGSDGPSLVAQLEAAGAGVDPLLAEVRKACIAAPKGRQGELRLVPLARKMGTSVADLVEHLQEFERINELSNLRLRSPEWHCLLLKRPTPSEAQSIAAELRNVFRKFARTQRDRARACWAFLVQHVAAPGADAAKAVSRRTEWGEQQQARSDAAHLLLQRYNTEHCGWRTSLFRELVRAPLPQTGMMRHAVGAELESAVRRDPRFLCSATRIARVCHGLRSPCCEGTANGHPLWGRFYDQDFEWLEEEAGRALARIG
eukprot:TRINITY_DN17592_c3_g1_i1.p1 TRINITY_DN17592_c3_g1~~TRINITY_DN17592_c3_g1_i1.p1  ORF type:complete len:959 (+),score=278.30 TRINITY_DN17592_c3_g1_i1:94-2877(+)